MLREYKEVSMLPRRKIKTKSFFFFLQQEAKLRKIPSQSSKMLFYVRFNSTESCKEVHR